MDLPKIFLLKTSTSNRGFTLIEILIVLAILAGIIAVGMPRLRLNNNNIKKVVRDLTVLTKEVRNQSRLKSMTHRLVFKLEGNEHSYWVESATGQVLAQSEDELKKISEMSEDERPVSPFQKSTKFFKKDRVLPAPYYFARIETVNRPTPVENGMAYIYFSPEGLVEQSVIQITDRKNMTWSLILNPLTGQADIVEKAFSLKDLLAK